VSTAQQQPLAGRTASAGSRFRTAFRAVVDTAMTGIALWGVWHQEHTGTQKPWLLLTYVVILGLIPATHAVAIARAALQQPSPQAQSPPDTGSPPSLPAA
jgi:hypothetical protein